MTRTIIAAVALLAGLAPALAALPPQYQRQTELTAIIAAVVDTFGIEHPIDGITMTGPDTWKVTGGDCTLEARIVDVPREDAEPGFAGPRNFVVEAGPVACP